jgi:hypothetical protein
MDSPGRELLQVALGSCVALAVMILIRDVVSLGRKVRGNIKSRPFREASPSAPNLPALETEAE